MPTQNLEKRTNVSSDVSAAFSSVSASFAVGLDDPYPLYRELRRTSPVMEGDLMAKFGVPSVHGGMEDRPAFTLFRYADAMAVLRDSATYSNSLIGKGLAPLVGDFALTAMDGEEHRKMRGLLQPCFSHDILKKWKEELLAPVIRDQLVAPLAKRAGCDLIDDFGIAFPIRVVYEVLGVMTDPETAERYSSWGLQILASLRNLKDPEVRRNAMELSQKLYDAIRATVEHRRAAGATGHDLISSLIRAEFEGRRLDDHEVTNFVRMLMPAATETTTRTFGSLMVLLLERPQLLERVRRDRSLLMRAIDEAVRFEPVASWKNRLVMRDVEIRGVKIPAGSFLSIAVGSANRDEDVFTDSETFNIDRPTKLSFGFGFGPHMCLGLFLAKAEIEVAVNAILDMCPDIRFDPDKPAAKIRGMHLRGPDNVHVTWG